MESPSGHRKARTELLKHVSATVILVIVVYIINNFGYFKGVEAYEYNIGTPFVKYALTISILQLLVSFFLAYRLAPWVYDKIKKGLNAYLMGLIALLICWTLPMLLAWLVVGLMEPDKIAIWSLTIYGFIPVVITGILAGRSLKKTIGSNLG